MFKRVVLRPDLFSTVMVMRFFSPLTTSVYGVVRTIPKDSESRCVRLNALSSGNAAVATSSGAVSSAATENTSH